MSCKGMSCSIDEGDFEWEEKIETDTTEEGKVIKKKIIIKKGNGEEDIRELEFTEE